MAKTQYLDQAGLVELVAQIKAADTAVKNFAGNITGKKNADGVAYTSVQAYLEDEIAKAQAAATFDGLASSVVIADPDSLFEGGNVEEALRELGTSIATLNGDVSKAGSVAKALADAIGNLGDYSTVKDYVDAMGVAVKTLIHGQTGSLADLATTNKTTIVAAINEVKGLADDAQDDVDALEALVGFTAGTGEDDPKTVKAYIDAEVAKATGDASDVASDLADEIARATKAESDLNDAIEAHKTAIDSKVTTLVGEDADKSVRTIAAEETAKIVDDAPEAFDTLKEIAEWIGTGDIEKTTAADLLTKTTANETAIAAINNETTGILKQAKDYADGLDTAMDARVDALEAAVGEGGAVADQIQAAIEELDTTVSQTAGADGLALTVVQEDGKLKSVSGSIAANTYDAYGSAAAVQGSTTETVASVDAKVQALEGKVGDGFEGIPVADVTALFA